MKIAKRIGIILASIILLIAAAAVIVPMVVDMSFIKPIAADAVKSQTGRDLYIDGDIKITILPRIGVSIEQISLSNASGFSPEKMFSAGEVQVGVKVLPLLSKKIEISKIIVDDVNVQYAVNKDGVSNIDDILKFMEEASSAGGNEPAEAEAGPEEASGMSIDIQNSVIDVLELNNFTAVYTDGKAGKTYTLAANLKADDVGLNASPRIHGNAEIKDDAGTAIRADLDVDMVLGQEGASIKTNKTTVVLHAAEQKAGITVDVNLNADYKTGAQHLIADFKGDVQAGAGSKRLDLTLETDVNYNIAAGILDISRIDAILRAAGVVKNEQSITLNTAVLMDMKKETLGVKAFKIKGAGLDINGSASGINIMSDPDIKANVTIAEFSPKKLMSELGIDFKTTDANALTKMSGQIDVRMAKQVFTVPVKINLDKSKITADIKANLSGKKPAITAALNIDSINANGYLPPAEPAKAPNTPQPAAPATRSGSMVPDIDLDLTGLPDLNITAKIGNLIIMDEKIGGLDINAVLKNGILTAKTSIANLHGGKLSADAKVTGVKNKFEADLNANLSSLSTKSVLGTYAPEVKLPVNTASASVKLNYKNSSKVVDVSNFSATLDTDSVSGNMKAELKPARPNITFVLNGGNLDLNKYLPKDAAQVAEAKPAAQPAPAANKEPLDLKKLIPVDVDGKISIKSVKYEQYVVSDLFAHIISKNGTVKLTPFTANLYGGSAKAEVDIKGADTSNAYNVSLTNVKVGELLQAISNDGKKPSFVGDLSASANLAATGLDVDGILATLEGKAQYTLKNGAINGIGYNPNLISMDTIKKFNLFDKNKSTPVKEVRGSVTIKKGGRVEIDPVHATSDNLNINVEGSVLILTQQYDLKGAVELGSTKVPMTITGPFSSPKIEIDHAKLISGLITQHTKETTKGLISIPVDAGKGIEQGIEKGLEKLFGK